MKRVDLLSGSFVGRLLRVRWPLLMVQVLALVGFLLAILAGLAGTPVGNRNFGIVVVWVAWWAVLILVAVPLLGRGWCAVCPLPAPGEWLQRGALLGPRGGGLGLGHRWPRRLRNIWLQNAGFVLLALFAAVVLTTPWITALLLLALLLVALVVGLVFERRAFCRYVCPVGGFIGLYSQLAPVELRVKDSEVCAGHREKTCYTGNGEGYGCPWQVFPGGLNTNVNCGLCFECVRTCPYDNIAFNLRKPGADLERPSRGKLDEAYKALIMLGSAIVYSAVLLGPWGALKNAAYHVGTADWFAYAGAFLAFVLVLIPGAFLAATVASRRFGRFEATTRMTYSRSARALVPLGLAAWIAFSLSFVPANLSYVWPVLSDPFGWGWNLIGTAGLAWTPYLSGLAPLLQTVVLSGGLFGSAVAARRIAGGLGTGSGRPARLAALPIVLFCLGATALLLVLLIG